MALFLRNSIWWTHFFVDGVRYRKSLNTRDRAVAERREMRLRVQAEKGTVSPMSLRPALRLHEALAEYLEDRRLDTAENTIRLETSRAKRLREHFGNVKLVALTGRDVRRYQAARREQGVSGRTVNLEVGILRRVLKRARRWVSIADDVKMLREKSTPGRALTEEEKRMLLSVNVTDLEHALYWENLLCAVRLALNTAMRGCELRGLRWRDIDFDRRTLVITRSKTVAGEREVPLNKDALAALASQREHAALLGAVEPAHYVFPACESFRVDPTRPQKSWRTAWRTLTRSIGLRGLRFHDLRHSAITAMLERGVPDYAVMAVVGHVDRRMLNTYSHIRSEARRRAVEALSSTPADTPLLPGHGAAIRPEIQPPTTQFATQSGTNGELARSQAC